MAGEVTTAVPRADVFIARTHSCLCRSHHTCLEVDQMGVIGRGSLGSADAMGVVTGIARDMLKLHVHLVIHESVG